MPRSRVMTSLASSRRPIWARHAARKRHALRSGVGEHIGQRPQPQPRLAGHREPAPGQQRPDLSHRPRDGGAVHPVQQRHRGVRKLEPQDHQGDDHPVRERQLMVRACALGAQPVPAAPVSQPRLLLRQPRLGEPSISLPSLRRGRPVQIRCDKAARAHPDDTSRSFRAAAHVPGIDTPQSPSTAQTSYRAPSR